MKDWREREGERALKDRQLYNLWFGESYGREKCEMWNVAQQSQLCGVEIHYYVRGACGV